MYFSWNADIDNTFRVYYENLVGEYIQPNPLTNADDTLFLVGSHRLAPEHVSDLQNEFMADFQIYENMPSGFEPEEV